MQEWRGLLHAMRHSLSQGKHSEPHGSGWTKGTFY
jgi:hypothetical protein